MTKRSIQTQKRVVMAVTTLFILATGCDDRFDPRGGNPSGEEKRVDVTLSIGLEDEADGYDLTGVPGVSVASKTSSPSLMKAGMDRDAAFRFDLLPSTQTKAGTSLKPEALYNLEIRQYSSTDSYLGGSSTVEATTPIGSNITVSLQSAEHCQLVLVAWGADNSRRLGTGNLSAVQDTIGSYLINDLKPEVQADMNKMPYVLHLKDVNVSQDGRIYSQDGEAIDIRLRLQRLAARLTFSWDYRVSGYTPQQILIHSIPTLYRVIASPDETDNTYPSLLDQFRTIQLSGIKTKDSYSCWIPANVRGSNPAATSQAYRIKSNAPVGSSYIRFIAVKNDDDKKKLDYRIYLGGKETTDFNLYGNRDYSYQATFNHSSTNLPVNDLRVTIVDPMPASEGNNNLVPTANCFMVAPGGAFCFDPFVFRQKEGDVDNTKLMGWSTTISKVRLLWQTLENGDVGDPVMGVVNSDTDHSNIVDIKNTLNNNAEFSKANGARIYCRVAPNTTGGSGLIVAYDADDHILWSWHVWVTDYNPDSRGNQDVQFPENKRKQKYSRSDLPDQLPMMDRNLGAFMGYTNTPPNPLEISKTNGFHYQWGRKDPFRSSYTKEKGVDYITVPVPNTAPVRHLLSFYQPDGITYYPVKVTSTKVSYQTAYQNPDILYKGEIQWNTGDADHATAWGDDDAKGLHDPCPAGWKICSIVNYRPFFTNTSYNTLNLSAGSTPSDDGGYVINYGNNNTTYLRLTGYWIGANSFTNIGKMAYYWAREKESMLRMILGKETSLRGSEYVKEAMPVRCIQEQN